MAVLTLVGLGLSVGACGRGGDPPAVVDTGAAVGDSAVYARPYTALERTMPSAVAGCDRAAPRSQHWDAQSTLLMDPTGPDGQLVAVTRAVLVAYPDIQKFSNRQFFRREVRIARLRLDGAFHGLPAGEYCISAAFSGTTETQMADTSLWRMYVYDVTRPGAPSVARMRVTYRLADAGPVSPGNLPTPPARFETLSDADLARFHGGAAGAQRPGPASLALTALAHASGASAATSTGTFTGTMLMDLRPPSPWYRCGMGCCGGDMAFEL